MKLKLAALLALLLTAGSALAQQSHFTVQTKVTIAQTNTFQVALAANAQRVGCLIQNNGTHAMYVFFGPNTPADLTTSFVLTAAQSISCAMSGLTIANDQVLITGTANDVATVSSQ